MCNIFYCFYSIIFFISAILDQGLCTCMLILIVSLNSFVHSPTDSRLLCLYTRINRNFCLHSEFEEYFLDINHFSKFFIVNVIYPLLSSLNLSNFAFGLSQTNRLNFPLQNFFSSNKPQAKSSGREGKLLFFCKETKVYLYINYCII